MTIVHHGSIVVVAKCPLPGKSKTRLIPLLGEQGSVALATAMLSDILVNLTVLKQSLLSQINDATTTATTSDRRIDLILLYAPADGRPIMEAILQKLQIAQHWSLMAMVAPSSPSAAGGGGDLQSSDLTVKLTDALVRVRGQQQEDHTHSNSHQNETIHRQGPVIFLGMDSPETPLDEIEGIFKKNLIDTVSSSMAVLCPAQDGGYGMLSVPPGLRADQVFTGVRWSTSLTAVSQLKAMSDAGISTRIGRLMYDVDEPDDVQSLWKRLQLKTDDVPSSSSSSFDVLLCSSTFPGKEKTGDCPHTMKVLEEVFASNHNMANSK